MTEQMKVGGERGKGMGSQSATLLFYIWPASRLHFLAARVANSRSSFANSNTLAKVNCRAIFVCINNGKFVIHIILIALAKSSQQQMTKNICWPRGQMRVKTLQMTHKRIEKTVIFIYTKCAGETNFDLNQIKYLNTRMLASAKWIMGKYFHNHGESAGSGGRMKY